MFWDFYSVVKLIKDEKKGRLLLKGNWGLEKESQRVLKSGDLALTGHPAVFGDKLENPCITTDFSESQLELVTPPFETVEKLYDYLAQLQSWVEKEIGDELLWPLSMPPRLPEEDEIPIARFNDTMEGKEKEIYRKGLALRYGKKMQMISGLHYNFSFGDEIFDFLYSHYSEGIEKRAFIDDSYLALTRNYLRYRWLLIYLFGASPDSDRTYYQVIGEELKTILKCCPECCGVIDRYGQYATSLRVSRFGYSNTAKNKYNLYFNSLEEYAKTLRMLLSAKSRKFMKLGIYRNEDQVQLNGNLLQKESEFYSPIRLKQVTLRGETQLEALEKRGVKYLEARILDLNPFEKVGISKGQLYFLQVFMLFCLFVESRPIDKAELYSINKNHHLTALSGRRPGLKLFKYSRGPVDLREWGREIFDKLRLIAGLIDEVTGGDKYSKSVEEEFKKLEDISLLPSSRIKKDMKDRKEDFLRFGLRRAIENKETII